MLYLVKSIYKGNMGKHGYCRLLKGLSMGVLYIRYNTKYFKNLFLDRRVDIRGTKDLAEFFITRLPIKI